MKTNLKIHRTANNPTKEGGRSAYWAGLRGGPAYWAGLRGGPAYSAGLRGGGGSLLGGAAAGQPGRLCRAVICVEWTRARGA